MPFAELFQKPLCGIVPPVITPMLGRDELDVAGLERLIDHLITGGVSGLFILGTTGEGPNLSHKLRREMVAASCKFTRDRVPVLVGITDTSFVEAIELAQFSAQCGAQAVVTSAPFYLPAGQPELMVFIEQIVKELPLPLFLYNMPSLTKVTFETETVARAMHMKQIVGIKDSSGDINYYGILCELAKQRADWTVLMGPEHLLARSVQLGGHGGVNGGALLNPKLFASLYHAAASNDDAAIATLSAQVAQIDRIYRVGKHASQIIKGIKCALKLMGICEDFIAEPFRAFNPPQVEQVRTILGEIGLLPSITVAPSK